MAGCYDQKKRLFINQCSETRTVPWSAGRSYFNNTKPWMLLCLGWRWRARVETWLSKFEVTGSVWFAPIGTFLFYFNAQLELKIIWPHYLQLQSLKQRFTVIMLTLQCDVIKTTVLMAFFLSHFSNKELMMFNKPEVVLINNQQELSVKDGLWKQWFLMVLAF